LWDQVIRQTLTMNLQLADYGIAFYSTVTITLLIHQLCQLEPDILQVWFADDATAVGSLDSLLKWWTHLQSIGLLYGYYPSAPKTHLIVKPESASTIFEGTNIQITYHSERHLGAAYTFVTKYVSSKVKKWTDEIEILLLSRHC